MPITTQATPAELVAAGRALLANWLQSYDSTDPMHNIAVIEIDRALKLGDFLNVQKNTVKDNTDKLKQYSALSQTIIDLRPADDNTTRILGQLGKEEPGKDDAAIIARANDFIDRMHANGLALDIRKADSSGKEVPWTSVSQIQAESPNRTKFNDWTNQLTNKTDYINTTAQQDQFNLQNILSLFNKSFEMATSFIKKLGDSLATVTHNVKAG